MQPKFFASFAIVFLLAASCIEASQGFPAEGRLKAELRPGMTLGEVIEHFGQPNSQVAVGDGSFLYRYVAPLGYLTADKEGYIGFELHFVEGKVHGWRTFRGFPSYEPIRPPSALKWYLRILLVVVICGVVLGVIRRNRTVKDEDQALLNAYVAKQIQTKRLPELQFITPDTTLQDVIDKIGAPSRTRELSFDSVIGSEKAAAHNVSGMSIRVAEYDLPYNAAAIVMPEYPGALEDRIRAVFYRAPQADEDL